MVGDKKVKMEDDAAGRQGINQAGPEGKDMEACRQCDLRLFRAQRLAEKLRKAIRMRREFHEDEWNDTAIESLDYIESLLSRHMHGRRRRRPAPK